MNEGVLVTPRGLPCYELTNFSVYMDAPWRIPFEIPSRPRALSPKIAAFEIASLIGQVMLEVIAPRALAQFADDGMMHGAYGPRVRGQIAEVLQMLKDDPNSRQAVISIYDGHRDHRTSRDIPCTVALQYFIRGGNLHARTCMRSNDAYLGLPYDLMQFCALQCFIADCLGIGAGQYYHTVGSMHVYESDVQDATHMCENWRTNWRENEPVFLPQETLFSSIVEPYEHGVRFCQSALAGIGVASNTSFEHWLWRSLQGEDVIMFRGK